MEKKIYGVGLIMSGSALITYTVTNKDETRNDFFKLTLAASSLILVSFGTYILVKS